MSLLPWVAQARSQGVLLDTSLTALPEPVHHHASQFCFLHFSQISQLSFVCSPNDLLKSQTWSCYFHVWHLLTPSWCSKDKSQTDHHTLQVPCEPRRPLFTVCRPATGTKFAKLCLPVSYWAPVCNALLLSLLDSSFGSQAPLPHAFSVPPRPDRVPS